VKGPDGGYVDNPIHGSKDAPPVQPALIYSPEYDLHCYGLERMHPFDGRKYSRAVGLLKERFGPRLAGWLREPQAPASLDELLRVHTADYLERLGSPLYLARVLELPLVASLPTWMREQRLLTPMRLAVSGTILAAREALSGGMAVNLAGGYHHAGVAQGEGFCAYADISIAIATLREEGLLTGSPGEVLVLDLDAHQGNGIERVHADDPGVRILDVYNAEIYPGDRAAARRIDFPGPLRSGTGDEAYLATLQALLPRALEQSPEVRLVFYNAGTDVYEGDLLGRLALSAEGVFQRDRFVFDTLAQAGLPWAMVTSGGYGHESHRLIARSVGYALETWG